MERVSSVEVTKDSFENVPKDKEYQFSIQNWLLDEPKLFVYKLKRGKELPYSVPLKGDKKLIIFALFTSNSYPGYNVVFSRQLVPAIKGFKGFMVTKEDGDWWVFDEDPEGSLSRGQYCFANNYSFRIQHP